MATGFIMKTLIYVISMELLLLSRKRSLSQNVPQRQRARSKVQHIAVAQIVVVRHGRIQKHVRHLGWVIGNLSNSS